ASLAPFPTRRSSDLAGEGGHVLAITLTELAEIVGGEVRDADPTVRVTGPVVADSRTAVPGALFVADQAGHDYAADAVGRGAVAVDRKSTRLNSSHVK